MADLDIQKLLAGAVSRRQWWPLVSAATGPCTNLTHCEAEHRPS